MDTTFSSEAVYVSVGESGAVGWSRSSFRIGQMCEHCVLGTAAAEIS